MDEDAADTVVNRHWQTVVNSIKAGAVDNDLESVIAAERRRDPPREVVIRALSLRRAAIDGVIDTTDDRE